MGNNNLDSPFGMMNNNSTAAAATSSPPYLHHSHSFSTPTSSSFQYYWITNFICYFYSFLDVFQ